MLIGCFGRKIESIQENALITHGPGAPVGMGTGVLVLANFLQLACPHQVLKATGFGFSE